MAGLQAHVHIYFVSAHIAHLSYAWFFYSDLYRTTSGRNPLIFQITLRFQILDPSSLMLIPKHHREQLRCEGYPEPMKLMSQHW